MQSTSDLDQQAEFRRRQVHQLVARTHEQSPLDSAQFREACLDKLTRITSIVESMQCTVPVAIERRLNELEQELDRVRSQMRDLSQRLDSVRWSGASAEEEVAAERVLQSLNNLVANLPGPLQADLPAQ